MIIRVDYCLFAYLLCQELSFVLVFSFRPSIFLLVCLCVIIYNYVDSLVFLCSLFVPSMCLDFFFLFLCPLFRLYYFVLS